MQMGIAVNWTEFERGWGSRPDGHTLYLTEEAARKHITDYWASMPSAVPDEYSRNGEPFYYPLTDEQVAQLKESDRGFIWGHVRNQVSPNPK